MKYSNIIDAVKGDSLEAIEALIAQGEDIEKPDDNGIKPLDYACMCNKVDILQILVDAGADIEANSEYIERCNLLFLATLHGHVDIVKILVDKGAKLDIYGLYGYTPIMCAIHYYKNDIVKILVDAGANLTQLSAEEKMTPIMILVKENNTEVLELILSNASKTINIQDQHGKTAMHYAAATGSTKATKMFVDAGADLYLTDKENNTPLMVAIKLKNYDVAHHMLKHDPNLINTQDASGNTALIRAIKECEVKLVSDLLELGADQNIGWAYQAAMDRDNKASLMLRIANTDTGIKSSGKRETIYYAENRKSQISQIIDLLASQKNTLNVKGEEVESAGAGENEFEVEQ